MATQVVTLDPVSRIEGHLRLDLEIRDNGVVSARSNGTSFRGFEPILTGRDPRDAAHITQRICGVCPVPHATAASQAFEMAAGYTVNAQARNIRNLVEGANFIDSHLLHFYALALPDYVAGLPTAGGWRPGAPPQVWEGRSGMDAVKLAEHAVGCLQARRDCNAISTLLGGKMPHPVSIVAGGATASVTAEMKATLKALVGRVRAFVDTEYQADVQSLAATFREYLTIGASGASFLSFGGYPTNDGGRLFGAGLVRSGSSVRESLDPAQITESVASARFRNASPMHPTRGSTELDLARADTYSFSKAPRLQDQVCEVGPLARSVVAGTALSDRGVLARHLARAAEASRLAIEMADWVARLEPGVSACPVFPKVPDAGQGAGLVEAPRGSLGHWLTIEGGVIKNYQVITPTTWNGSPRDEQGRPGPLEKSLEGVAVADPADPIEVMRVVHSFDPCLQCAVH